MRKLTKGPIPHILAQNASKWTADLLARRAGDLTIPKAAEKRYRHSDIRAAVEEEAAGKCVDCESHVTHSQPGDIEHFRPKSLVPELAFEWTNLLLACRNCNHSKGEYDDSTKPLVNPFSDPPSSFLRAFGPLIEGVDPGGRGMITEQACGLNRADLLLWRSKVIQKLKPLVELWKKETDPSLAAAWKSQLIAAASKDSEYTFVATAYLSHHAVLTGATNV